MYDPGSDAPPGSSTNPLELEGIDVTVSGGWLPWAIGAAVVLLVLEATSRRGKGR